MAQRLATDASVRDRQPGRAVAGARGAGHADRPLRVGAGHIGTEAMARVSNGGGALPATDAAPSAATIGRPAAVLTAAARIADIPGTGLPHRAAIQRSFGRHAIAGVAAHADALGAGTAASIGAAAFTFGEHIAFAAPPSLRLAAHEAAHVVQQRSGVSLANRIGRAGDVHERRADRVADLVAQGRSAEAELAAYPAASSFVPAQVQYAPPDDPAAADRKVYFPITFTKTIASREEFIDLAERTIYGRRINLVWTNVKDSYAAAASPIMVHVPASTLQGRLADYGSDVGGVIKGLDKVADAATYQRLNRLIQKLTPAQWADYASRVAVQTASLDDFEKSIDAYLASAQQRDNEHTVRDDKVKKLFGLEALYIRYRDYWSLMGVSVAEGHALQTDLVAAGFPGGIIEFGNYVAAYLDAFRTETARIGDDLMQKYDSTLYKEDVRYADDGEVAKLHAALKPVRDELAAFEADAKVWNDYAKAANDADSLGRVPGNGGAYPVPSADTKAAAEAARGRAEQHREAARTASAAASVAFPILREDNLPLDRRLDKVAVGRADPAQLKALLQAHIAARRGDVKKTRETLAGDADVVFSLDKLLAASMTQQGVAANSIYAMIIEDAVKAKHRADLLVNLLIAVVAIALTVVSLGTGAVAVAAAGAVFGLSAGLAVQQFRSYETEHAAYGAGLLSDDPSVAWVIVAVVGAAVDLGAAVKAVRALSPLAKALNEGVAVADAAAPLAKFNEGLKALEKAGEIDAKIAQNVERAAAARAKAAAAARDLGATLGSRMYSFPGPLADPAVYRDVVRLAFYKGKEIGYDFLKFVEELRQLRSAAKLADFSDAEKVLLKKAYDEGRAFSTEADLLKFARTRPLGVGTIVVDENMIIARGKRAAGTALQPGETKMLAFLDANKSAKLAVPEELYDKLVARGADVSDLTVIERSLAQGAAEETKILTALDAAKVGATKGAEDRRLIAQALLAKTEGGAVPTFVTHDPGIYNNLYRMTGKNPVELGKALPEALPGGFRVEIEGHKLDVIGILRK